MKLNHLVPATVSILSLAVLTACQSNSSTAAPAPTTTSSGQSAQPANATPGGASSNPARQSPQSSPSANQTNAAQGQNQAPSAGQNPTATAQAPAPAKDSSSASYLKPYQPPKAAPGFPGKGDAKNWTKATKFYNQGIDASSSKDYAAAIKLYKQAIAVYPYDPNFYANLGFATERNGDPALGVEACKKAIELQKDFGGAWENLGNCQYDLGHLKESREAFNQALNCELPMSKRNELIQVVNTLTAKINGK